jgi:hypothetical protein
VISEHYETVASFVNESSTWDGKESSKGICGFASVRTLECLLPVYLSLLK